MTFMSSETAYCIRNQQCFPHTPPQKMFASLSSLQTAPSIYRYFRWTESVVFPRFNSMALFIKTSVQSNVAKVRIAVLSSCLRKSAHSSGGSEPHIIMVSWTHMTAKGILNGLTIFAHLTHVTDTQTDRQIHRQTTLRMRCDLVINLTLNCYR